MFDVDGVLIQSNVFKQDAYYEIFANVPGATRSVISSVLSERPRGDRFHVIGRILETVRGTVASRVEVEQYAGRYNTICLDFAIRCDEVRGAERGLAALAAVYPLYTNSATPQEPLAEVISGRKWTHHFREVLGGPRSKADNLRYIAEREGTMTDSLVLVGDELRDLDAAREVGAYFIGLRNRASDFAEAPALEFDNMDDVTRHLLAARRETR